MAESSSSPLDRLRLSRLPWVPRNFLALSDDQSDLPRARAVVITVPYDSTTSFRSGARDGPAAIIEALELDATATAENCITGITALVEGGDGYLYATADGVVKYERLGRDRKKVSVYPG